MKIVRGLLDIFFSGAEKRVCAYLKVILFFKKRGWFKASLFFCYQLQRRYGVYISPKTVFNQTLLLRHPTSIVIGEGAIIGSNVIIYQNVTLGRSDSNRPAYPTIGDDVTIYSGAVIIGDVKVGRGCVIGANAVVTKNVPDFHLAVGIPARILPLKN